MRNLILRFREGEVAVPVVEFGLVCGLSSIVIAGIVTTVGQELINVFREIQAALSALSAGLNWIS
jgi:Flp pilus assembly pilin Flp